MNTVERCSVLCEILEEKNFSTIALHSSMTQVGIIHSFMMHEGLVSLIHSGIETSSDQTMSIFRLPSISPPYW